MKATHRPTTCFALPFATACALLMSGIARSHGGVAHPGLDANENRVSDIYEALYPAAADAAADSDGDGATNEAESVAATNPFDTRSFLHVSAISAANGTVTATWLSVRGKSYRLQATGKGGASWVNAGDALPGTGGALSASFPIEESRKMLRVQVSDIDTDADGVTDWEELQAGTDPYLWDTDGDGRSDRGFVESRLGVVNTVEVAAVSTWASETGPRAAQFRLTRRGGFLPITVQFTTGGTAVMGADYALSATSATFAAGAREALVTMTPLADAQMEEAETVTLSLAAGTNYQIGTASSATITIISQGLTGQYFDTANGTYNNSLNFDPAQLKLTRRDAAVDFDWSPGTPHPSIVDDDVWSVRWTGFIYPKTSEVYQIHAYADRGVVVWVSPTPITTTPGDVTGARLNVWSTGGPAVKNSAAMLANSAAAAAGQPLYFRVDYRDSASTINNSNVQLRWSAPGVPEEVIPASAFSTEGFTGAVPVITSPPAISGIAGAPFSFQLTANNAPAGWSVGGLPPGLTVDAAGLISGALNASQAQGYYQLTVTAANAAGSDSELVVLYVTTTGGSATREVWNGVSGNGLAAIPLHTAPSSSGTVSTLESPDNYGDNYGERLRGYLTAPATGLYTFFLTSDESAELWISSSEEPAQRLKRSWVSGVVADGVWDTLPGQKSLSMRMTAGRRYYFEALRRETTGPDHLAIAWLKPGQTDAALKEIIPGWALTRYTPPAITGADGTLYAASLTPQTGASTLGSGSALLLVNESHTEARLSYTYSNLTGPVNSGAHIHDSRTITGQAGRIIYDVDDFPPDIYGNHTWVFEPSVSHTVADILAAVEGGTAYLNLHTTAYPNGEVKGFFYPVSGSQFFIPPAAPEEAELTLPADTAAAEPEVIRFLQQATFGARHDADGIAPWDADSIEAVRALGLAGWVAAQIAMPAGTNPETLLPVPMPPTVVYAVPTDAIPLPNAPASPYYGSGPFCSWISAYYQRYPLSSTDTGQSSQSAEELWRAWWALSVKAPDQLRHRMAFALSQIIVASEEGGLSDNARAVGHYYDLLYYHGLGNFRTLLERVALSPAMGVYLDMLGNKKPNPAIGYIPNENFAREVLQLFSVGLTRLHPDGSAVLSISGAPVPTYEQDNVVGFAHTFTGWNYPGTSGNKISAMTPIPSDHATGQKLLLEETIIPASATATAQSCNAELAAALDVIFHHPNTGPFICRQLIQRMVTANPSPGYIYRVASVFDNDGTGVRGNLAAVASAILLDPEARNAQPRLRAGFGHLKEPVIRATQMLRAFNGFSYAERNFGSTADLGTVISASQVNMDLTQPLPTTDFTINTVITPYTLCDGIVLAAGNAVLVKSQANPAENGLYIFNGNGSPLLRALNADAAGEVNQAWVKVLAGTNAAKYFRQTAAVTTVGTDAQTWTEQTSPNTRSRMWAMSTTISGLNQNPLKSPTVFNFFEPNYVFLGSTGANGLVAPEFQITTETTVINTGNWFYDLAGYSGNTSATYTFGQGYDHGGTIRRDIKLDLAAERAIAADSAALLDRLGILLMPGQMDPRLKTLVANYLETLPEANDADKMKRIGEALYLISLTPEFSWQK